LGPNIALKQLK